MEALQAHYSALEDIGSDSKSSLTSLASNKTNTFGSTTDGDSENPTISTASSRQLGQWPPINYSEIHLTKLHSYPQVRTINNLSVPLTRDEDADSEDRTVVQFLISIVSLIHN